MSNRVSLYLQDAHDLREGLDYVRYAEQKGFEAGAVIRMMSFSRYCDLSIREVKNCFLNKIQRLFQQIASSFRPS